MSLENRKMFGLVLVTVLSLAGAASADILFSDDFSSGTLDNWTKDGRSSWIQDVGGDNYVVVPANGSGSYASIDRSIDTSGVSSTNSWSVTYDLGWWDNHDPQLNILNFGSYCLTIRQGSYSYKWSLSLNDGATLLDESGGADESGSRTNPTFIGRKLAWDAETKLLTGSVWDGSEWVVMVSATGDYGLDAAATTLKFKAYDTVNWCGTSLDNIVVSAVPEPTTMVLLGLGGLALLRRHKK